MPVKFSCDVEIDAPRELAASIFAVPENKRHWHDDFVDHEQDQGNPGTPGSVTKLNFKKFTLIETVVSNSLPDEYTGEYLAEGICWNTMANRFIDLGNNRTLYEVDIEYKFIGLIVKIMAKIMPGMFKKQVQKTLDRFKQYVESQV